MFRKLWYAIFGKPAVIVAAEMIAEELTRLKNVLLRQNNG